MLYTTVSGPSPGQPLDPFQGDQERSEGDQADRRWFPANPGERHPHGNARTAGGGQYYGSHCGSRFTMEISLGGTVLTSILGLELAKRPE